MQNEKEIRRCRYCDQEKSWIFFGQKMKDGTKIYKNEKGLRWSGRRCPDCERQRVQAALKSTYFDRGLIKLKLEQEGYEVLDLKSDIILVRQPDGQIKKIALRTVGASSDGLLLSAGSKLNEPEDVDFYAVLFSSVKLVSVRDMMVLEKRSDTFLPPRKRMDSVSQPSMKA